MAAGAREDLIDSLHQQRAASFRSLQQFSVEWRAPHGGEQRYRAWLRATTPRGIGLQFLGDRPEPALLPEGLALAINATTASGIISLPVRVARYDPLHGALAAVIVGSFSQRDRRQHPRATVELVGGEAATLTGEGEADVPFPIQTIDLSGGGAQFVCRPPLGLLDLVQMVLPLGEGQVISPVLRVLNSRPEPTVPRALLTPAERRANRPVTASRVRGVFVELDPSERPLLERFMERLLHGEPDPSAGEAPAEAIPADERTPVAVAAPATGGPPDS
jgi:hypothetical protein